LRSDVLKSLTDARAARLNLYSAQKAFEAQSGAYSDTKKRYEIGTANSFELITSKIISIPLSETSSSADTTIPLK
jgi:hypothetical protein